MTKLSKLWKCPELGCDFFTNHSGSKSAHKHQNCPICNKLFLATKSYEECIASHSAQKPDGYSLALEEIFERNLKALERGKLLAKEVSDRFESETKNQKYYLYFVLEPFDKHPTSLKDFVSKICYIGRGQGRRMNQHGYNLSMLMKEWRSVGKRAFGFKVLVDLTSDEAYVYERAVLQAIGSWQDHICNEDGGHKIKQFDWSPDDDAYFGAQILFEAFNLFTSTEVEEHWRYLLEVRKQRSAKKLKKVITQFEGTMNVEALLEQLNGKTGNIKFIYLNGQFAFEDVECDGGTDEIDEEDYNVEHEGEKNPFTNVLDVGLARTSIGAQKSNSETQFDSRLFNQDFGLDSGGIDDKSYAVYSKTWRPQDNIQQSIYRPRQQAENPYGDDLDEIVKTQRFVPAKGFQGAEAQPGQAPRQAPVEFEKEDIFGISKLFQTSSSKDKESSSSSSKRQSNPSKQEKTEKKKMTWDDLLLPEAKKKKR